MKKNGHLGIWAALKEIHPEGEEQRCWNHKIINVLDRFPKKVQPEARELLKAMPYAETHKQCGKLKASFILRYRKNYSKACEILENDWERMVTFYSFPKEHWVHLRTTNIVESPFAVVRLRTAASKRFKKVENATAMIWKILQVAQKSWRKFKGSEVLNAVYEGKKFVDGLQISEMKTKEKLAA